MPTKKKRSAKKPVRASKAKGSLSKQSTSKRKETKAKSSKPAPSPRKSSKRTGARTKVGKAATKAEVLAYLKREQDPRGMEHWKAHRNGAGGLDSFGIGLTRLRKYAKTLGRDAKLAGQLWKTKVYEAKVLALLIDEPKLMTIEQAEAQVEELQGGYLAHVFSSCDATLAKAPFVLELLEKWVRSKDPVRRRCGYGLLYEVSKWKKKSAPADSMFLEHVDRIDRTQAKQPLQVRISMAGCLMGIGGRSVKLHRAALRAANSIGPIDFDPDGRCDPFDAAKHLQKKVFGERRD